MDALQQKIKQITEEHNAKEAVKQELPGIEALVFIHSDRLHIVVKAKTLAEAKKALETYPATSKEMPVGLHEQYINSPYICRLSNPSAPNQWNFHHLSVNWISNGRNIDVKIPVGFFDAFLRRSERFITDTELGYFTGESRTNVLRRKVLCYEFKQEQVSFYAGYRTLTNTAETADIVNHIINSK